MLQLTATKNDTACNLIASGDYRTAVILLLEALEECKAAIVTLESQPSHLCASNALLSVDDIMTMGLTQTDTAIEELKSTADNTSFIYRWPIAVTKVIAQVSAPSDVQHHAQRDVEASVQATTNAVLPVAVVFNLALAHHLCSQESTPPGSRQTFLFGRALKLYQMAYTLYSKLMPCEMSHSSPLAAGLAQHGVFVLATCNNMGAVCESLTNYAAAQNFYNRVLQILLYQHRFANVSELLPASAHAGTSPHATANDASGVGDDNMADEHMEESTATMPLSSTAAPTSSSEDHRYHHQHQQQQQPGQQRQRQSSVRVEEPSMDQPMPPALSNTQQQQQPQQQDRYVQQANPCPQQLQQQQGSQQFTSSLQFLPTEICTLFLYNVSHAAFRVVKVAAAA